MTPLARCLTAAVLMMLASAHAAEPPQLLDENASRSANVLPPPSTEQSPETRAELDLILRLQDQRTPEQIARIKADAQLTVAGFSGVLGAWCMPVNLPRTQRLLQHLEREANPIGTKARADFARRRPKFLDERIKPALEGLDDPCYPSGNGMRGMLYAVVLAELAPDQKEAIFERGREIGWSRVIAGVHYPSDIMAGRVLGVALARSALAKPGFQQELAKAKEEFAAARKR